jgi:chorismate mutase-like protein
MDLTQLRQRIDDIDQRLVALLNERIEAAGLIGELKHSAAAEVYAPEREKEVLARVRRANGGSLSADALDGIYREIMSAALQVETDFRLAIPAEPDQGVCLAVRGRFGDSVALRVCPSVGDALRAVSAEGAHHAVAPVDHPDPAYLAASLRALADSDLSVCTAIESSDLQPARYLVLGPGANPVTGDDRTCLILTGLPACRTGEDIAATARACAVTPAGPVRVAATGDTALGYLEVSGHPADAEVAAGLARLNEASGAVRVLGGYPAIRAEACW